jgi:hypothetical protein
MYKRNRAFLGVILALVVWTLPVFASLPFAALDSALPLLERIMFLMLYTRKPSAANGASLLSIPGGLVPIHSASTTLA